MPLTDPALTQTTLWVESSPDAGDYHPLQVRNHLVTTACDNRATIRAITV